VRLKDPLCKVETDDANLFHGCPLRSWDAKTSPPWHTAMPSGGGIHSITYLTVQICEASSHVGDVASINRPLVRVRICTPRP
jgi:hypothetical protein